VTYAPSEEGLRIMKSLGYADQIAELRTVDAALKNNKVAVHRGTVYLKEDGVVRSLLSPSEIHDLREFVSQSETKPSLRSLEFENTGKLILVRTLGDSLPHQIWIARNPQNTPILEDGLYCLHFNQPAVDSNGTALEQEQIFYIVENLGIMLRMTHQGRILIRTIAES